MTPETDESFVDLDKLGVQPISQDDYLQVLLVRYCIFLIFQYQVA